MAIAGQPHHVYVDGGLAMAKARTLRLRIFYGIFPSLQTTLPRPIVVSNFLQLSPTGLTVFMARSFLDRADGIEPPEF